MIVAARGFPRTLEKRDQANAVTLEQQPPRNTFFPPGGCHAGLVFLASASADALALSQP